MELITKREAAARLDMSTRTLDRLAAAGKIGRYYLSARTVRYAAEEVEAYKASCKVIAAPAVRQRKKPARRPRVSTQWKPGEKLV